MDLQKEPTRLRETWRTKLGMSGLALRREARRRLQELEDAGIVPAAKSPVRDVIEAHLLRIVYEEGRLMRWGLVACLCLLAVAFAATNYIRLEIVQFAPNSVQKFAYLGISFADLVWYSMGVIGLITFLPILAFGGLSQFSRRTSDSNLGPILVLVAMCAEGILGATLLWTNILAWSEVERWLVISAVGSIWAIFIAGFGSTMFTLVLLAYHLARLSRSYPATCAVILCLQSLDLLRSERLFTLNITHINKLIDSLDVLRWFIRKRIWISINTSDSIEKQWTQNMFEMRAEAVKELQRWVINPREGTWEELSKRLTMTLHALALGHWADLASVEVSKAKTSTVLQHLGPAIRTITLGCLPALLLHLTRDTSFAVTEPQLGYARAVSLVWCFVCFALVIDPDLIQKLNVAKAILDLARKRD